MLQELDVEIDEAQFRRLCDLVHRHCGINLHDGKQELVRARVARQLRATKAESASQYLAQVMANPDGEEFRSLIDALSTNLTSFFREPTHFDYVARQVLPALTQRMRPGEPKRIRAWSAACSTGEEPYTLAMTIREALGEQEAERWDVKILATDISRNVLRKAAAGTYDVARTRSIPTHLRDRYFHANAPDQVEVTPQLRSMIKFNYLNLIEPWPFAGPFDFIFCRNVMIYFDKPTQERLVNRFWNCLRSGGALFTGHSESLTGISHRFRYAQPTIYLKA